MVISAAFIRGIGPGDPRKSNASLIAAATAAGLSEVRSVASSGNLVFHHPGSSSNAELETLLEGAWEGLGFSATTVVRSYDEIAALLGQAPFGDRAHGRESYQLVTFLKAGPAHLVAPPPEMAIEVLGLAGGALCTISDATATGTPDVMRWFERIYSRQITSRTPGALAKIKTAMEKLAAS